MPSKKNNHSTPDILEYTSLKDYLLDYFNYRNELDGHFSYEIWSSELNYKSRAFLPLIIAGQRNATTEFINNFSKKMKFNPAQIRHLSLLALLPQASPPEIKEALEEGLLKTLDVDKNRSQLKEEGFLSFIFNPLLLTLISLKGFSATFDNLQSVLSIGETHLKQALAHLERLQLIYIEENEEQTEKIWKSANESFEVKNSIDNSDLQKFHKDTQREVLGQLDHNDETKKFRSVYFSISPLRRNDLFIDIEEFIKKLRIKYHSENIDPQQIMKFNLQTYPLSEVFNKNESSLNIEKEII